MHLTKKRNWTKRQEKILLFKDTKCIFETLIGKLASESDVKNYLGGGDSATLSEVYTDDVVLFLKGNNICVWYVFMCICMHLVNGVYLYSTLLLQKVQSALQSHPFTHIFTRWWCLCCWTLAPTNNHQSQRGVQYFAWGLFDTRQPAIFQSEVDSSNLCTTAAAHVCISQH